MGTVAELMRTPWGDRLVFGSHAPLFIPYSAVARVVLDLDDPTALRVLRDNAATLLKARLTSGVRTPSAVQSTTSTVERNPDSAGSDSRERRTPRRCQIAGDVRPDGHVPADDADLDRTGAVADGLADLVLDPALQGGVGGRVGPRLDRDRVGRVGPAAAGRRAARAGGRISPAGVAGAGWPGRASAPASRCVPAGERAAARGPPRPRGPIRGSEGPSRGRVAAPRAVRAGRQARPRTSRARSGQGESATVGPADVGAGRAGAGRGRARPGRPAPRDGRLDRRGQVPGRRPGCRGRSRGRGDQGGRSSPATPRPAHASRNPTDRTATNRRIAVSSPGAALADPAQTPGIFRLGRPGEFTESRGARHDLGTPRLHTGSVPRRPG